MKRAVQPTLDTLLEMLAECTRVPVVNASAASGGQRLPAAYVMESARLEPGEAETPKGQNKLQDILDAFSAQTGLTFSREERRHTLWLVTKAE
mgnify:CR=1 FL=1